MAKAAIKSGVYAYTNAEEHEGTDVYVYPDAVVVEKYYGEFGEQSEGWRISKRKFRELDLTIEELSMYRGDNFLLMGGWECLWKE